MVLKKYIFLDRTYANLSFIRHFYTFMTSHDKLTKQPILCYSMLSVIRIADLSSRALYCPIWIF